MSSEALWPAARPLLGIVVRAVVLYGFVMVLVRLAGRRGIGHLSPWELLSSLLVAAAAGPGLTSGDRSVAAGLVATTTLMSLTVLVSLFGLRSQTLAGTAVATAAEGGRVPGRRTRRPRRKTRRRLRREPLGDAGP